MKLLFLIEDMSPRAGGPAVEISRLVDLLSKETEITATVASLTPPVQALPLGSRVAFFQFQNPKFFRLSWFKAIQDLRRLIEENDIIFTTGVWGPIDGFALNLAWKKNKPVYIRVCGMLEPYILARNPLKKAIALSIYVRKNVRYAKGIIVNSPSEALHVRDSFVLNGRLLTIPNGLEIFPKTLSKIESKKRLGINVDKPVLLYLGRLHPKKGLHLLLKAIGSLPLASRNFTLLIAGNFFSKEYQKMIETLVNNLDLYEIVKFTGLVLGEDKVTHFCAADCFVLPSESEGLPNAVLEAMAYGLPVIITSGCNMAKVSDYRAGLVIDLTLENLVKAIEWFISGDKSLKEASKNALTYIKEQFNPEKTLRMYKEIITSEMSLLKLREISS